MNFFQGLFSNTIFISAASGWLIAQILKTVIHLYFTKTFVAERLVGSGGMPSSHSATVCALCTATSYEYGSDSFEFAICLIVALIVMYDAMGVRRETGKQSVVINQILSQMLVEGKPITEKQLKELVGHTPLEVAAGVIVGLLVTLIFV